MRRDCYCHTDFDYERLGFQAVFQETLSNQQRDFQQCGPTRQEVRLWTGVIYVSALHVFSNVVICSYIIVYYSVLYNSMQSLQCITHPMQLQTIH